MNFDLTTRNLELTQLHKRNTLLVQALEDSNHTNNPIVSSYSSAASHTLNVV